MGHEERDEFIKKFRDLEISVIVSTDMLSRGFDVPELQFVINADVPRETNERREISPGYDAFMHRAGRAGRFA